MLKGFLQAITERTYSCLPSKPHIIFKNIEVQQSKLKLQELLAQLLSVARSERSFKR